jgi:hypothetical protein
MFHHGVMTRERERVESLVTIDGDTFERDSQ